MHRDTDFEITAFKLQAPVVHEIVNVLYLCGVLGFHWMHKQIFYIQVALSFYNKS